MMQSMVAAVGRRVLTTALWGAIALSLVACGTSKPEPARLESFQPSARVSVVWQQRLGGFSPDLSLTRVGDTVAASSTDGLVVAWQVDAGQERWRGEAAGRLTAGVGTDGRYAAVVTDLNELVVLDQGRALWRQPLPGRVTTPPLVAGERVFIMMLDRQVRAYDVMDGRWLWQYQRPGSDTLALATRGVLQAFRDTLLVGQGSRMVGLDPTRGTVRFDINVGTPRGTNEVERLADLVGPLARADDEACVRAFQLSVACLELNRGSVRWTRPQSGIRGVAADERVVVGADGADRLSAWAMENGQLLWRVDRFARRGLSAPVIWGRHAAAVDEEGYLHVLALDDGRTVARFELDAALAGAPMVAQDLLVVATRKGTVLALRLN